MTQSSPPEAFAATYRLQAALPNRLICGEPLLLDIELQNTGYTPWLNSGTFPVRLGYRWVGLEGALIDGGRALLPAPVPPDMGAQVELWIESPPEPGEYQLQIELLEEGRAWFSQCGVPALRVEMTYATATAPRVAIINGNVIANDAVGGHVVSQLLVLREAGYHVMVITEYIDSRLPADVRRSIEATTLAEMRRSDVTTRTADHFRQADIVIVNYSTYYHLVEIIRDVRRGVVIFDYHGVTPPEIWGREWPGYEDLVRGVANLDLVRYADYAIGHSRYTADELIATGRIAPSRVSVIPYAVVEKAGYAGAPDPEIVERFGLTGKHVLLYVGRIARNKRVIDLVEALPTILARHPDTVLLIIGENRGPAYEGYVDEIYARAVDLGVAEQTIFVGPIDHAKLDDYYRACTVFLMASVHEGFCIPVVEAMARGRPVVAANITATPDTLGEGGLVFPAQDPVGLAAQVCALLDDLPAPGDHSDPLAVHRLAPASAKEVIALRERPIAVVTPRYGWQVLGGAETGLRSWAEQLAARGYRVEALTTCTIDLADWRDHVPPGVEDLNGVTVRRFSTGPVDPGTFHLLLQQANRGERLRYFEEERFMASNLRSADLERYVAEHADEYACLIYTPYLFGTCYWPSLAVPERSMMVPCLHDEASARLVMFREMLERSSGLFFNSDPESDFSSAELEVANPYRVRIGYGFSDEPRVGDAAAFRARSGIDVPFILYSGRLERGKNVPLLLDFFVRYKAERPTRLNLVLAGSGDVLVPKRPDIIDLGMISDQQLLSDAYAAALALCQLSLNESFSIVIMEAWLQGRPVIVHGDCAVTRDHIEKSGGGYAPSSYEEFRAALDALVGNPAHADDLGIRGRAYVQDNYSWSSLLPRIEAAIASFSRPRSLYARQAQRGVARALAFTRTRFNDAMLELVARAKADLPSDLGFARRASLLRTAEVARPSYYVRSRLPLIGPAIAWLRRQITSHLKEPYLDPMIAGQDRFNRDLLETLLPTLDESLREQRRLRAEVDLLRAQLVQRDGHDDPPSV